MNKIGREHHKGMWQGLRFGLFDWARRLRCHWIAILVLVTRLGLGSIYSVAIPIWEAYDEDGHYQYARYIATKRALPQPGDPEAEAIWEKFQPPLYYLLAATSMSWIDVSDDLPPTLNPYLSWGTSGINYAIHPDSEGFPYKGTVLALHVIRLLSVAIATVGVLFTYLIGLVIAPQRRWIAVGAMAVHAFWPQFLFNGSVVTNDVLAATMSSLVTFLIIWIVERGARGLHLIAVGISLGLSLLCKVNTIALFPIAVAVLIRETVRKLRDLHDRKDWGWGICLVLSFLIVVLAYQVLNNLSLFRIPGIRMPGIGNNDKASSLSGVIQGLASILEIFSWGSVGVALRYSVKTFYASFGWGNLEVAAPLYRANGLLAALAFIGVVTMLVRGQRVVARPALLVCTAVVLAMLLLVLAVAAHTEHVFYAHGRYLLPGMSAFSILLFTGWFALWPIRARKPLALIAPVVMFMIALVLPFDSIIPAYAKPRLLSQDEIEAVASPLEARFDDLAELLGYRVSSRKTKPGRLVGVTLYWRALTKPRENYTVRVEIVGPGGQGHGRVDSYPANGKFATSLWEPGDIFEDLYIIRISDEFPAPAGGLITIALVGEDGAPLPVYTDEGLSSSENDLPLQQIGVYSSSSASLCDDVVEISYELGGQIKLVGYSISRLERLQRSIRVTLCWRAIAEVDEDYMVFVHLRDSTGKSLSQHDGPPRHGYYPTSLWAPGEIVADEHYLNVAPESVGDEYQIYVGMYRLETLGRLQVLDDDRHGVANDEILLEQGNPHTRAPLSPPAGDALTLPGIYPIAEQSPRCLELTTDCPDAAISAASAGKENGVGTRNVKSPVI